MYVSYFSRRRFSLLLGAACMAAAVGCLPSARAQSTSSLDAVLKRGTLRVGWAPWYPYAFKDPKTNQVGGITLDLMKDLATQMKVKVEFVEDGWGTMIAGLQADKFDLLMPMAVTPPREEAATFSNPFTKVNLGVMIKKADQGKYASWKDLDRDGVSISVAMGSNTALYAKQDFSKAKIIEMKGEPEAVTSLITGKVTAWASTYSAFSDSAPGREQLVVVPGEPFAFSPIGVVIRKDDAPMRDYVNKFLAQYRSSGALLALIKKNGLSETDLAQ